MCHTAATVFSNSSGVAGFVPRPPRYRRQHNPTSVRQVLHCVWCTQLLGGNVF